MVECALMASLSSVLSLISIFRMPNGGSVTLACMSPIILISLRHGPIYGFLSGFILGIMQLVIHFQAPPSPFAASYFIVIALDYILAYMSPGISPIISAHINNRSAGILLGTIVCMLIRYIISVISGVIIWKELFPPQFPALAYSMFYNACYLIPETIITSIVCIYVYKYLPSLEK